MDYGIKTGDQMTLIMNVVKNTTELKPHPENITIYGNEEVDIDLLNSVREKGILEPIVIKSDNTILSGHRRWLVAMKLELDKVPCRIMSFNNVLDELEALIEFNRQREKTFTQKMNEADKIKWIEAERARQRHLDGSKNGADITNSGQYKDSRAELTSAQREKHYNVMPETNPFTARMKEAEIIKENIQRNQQARDAVAEKIGMKKDTYTKAAKVWQRAKEGDEKAKEIIKKVDAKEITINKAYNEVIKKPAFEEHIQKQREDIESGAAQLPQGTFEILVIDPPWNYGTQYNADGRRVANPYPEMSHEELMDLEIPASNNSIMFLWTTHKFIWDAKNLLNEWGFDYRNILVWNKEKIGMGDLFRMQCEFCLVGIKGKPTIDNDHTWRDIISEARREHSRKPDAFYDMVDKLCVGRKLDYFSRIERPGWATFGNDTGRFS